MSVGYGCVIVREENDEYKQPRKKSVWRTIVENIGRREIESVGYDKDRRCNNAKLQK